MKKQRVLKIRDLSISFKTGRGMVDAIRGVKLDLFKGETLSYCWGVWFRKISNNKGYYGEY